MSQRYKWFALVVAGTIRHETWAKDAPEARRKFLQLRGTLPADAVIVESDGHNKLITERDICRLGPGRPAVRRRLAWQRLAVLPWWIFYCALNLHHKAYDTRTMSGWLKVRHRPIVYIIGWSFWVLVAAGVWWLVRLACVAERFSPP